MDGLAGEPRYAANVAAMHTIKDLKYEDAVSQLRNIDLVESLRHGNFATETAALIDRNPLTKSTAVATGEEINKTANNKVTPKPSRIIL